jgi:hypothetical protein
LLRGRTVPFSKVVETQQVLSRPQGNWAVSRHETHCTLAVAVQGRHRRGRGWGQAVAACVAASTAAAAATTTAPPLLLPSLPPPPPPPPPLPLQLPLPPPPLHALHALHLLRSSACSSPPGLTVWQWRASSRRARQKHITLACSVHMQCLTLHIAPSNRLV